MRFQLALDTNINDRQSHNDENQESCVFLFDAVGRCVDAINGAYDRGLGTAWISRTTRRIGR